MVRKKRLLFTKTDKDGKETYNYTAPTATKEEVAAKISGEYKQGVGNLEGKAALQKRIYDGFRNAGFSEAQSKALTAEVGRENSYDAATVFGTHLDPKNNKVNLGMLSMQGSRGTALYNHMKEKGLIDQNGHIVKSQESINEMARFYKTEMQTSEKSPLTKEFLENKDIDRKRAAFLLGSEKGYIRWRYSDSAYASGHKNRDEAYDRLEKNLGQFKQPTGDVEKISKEEYYEHIKQVWEAHGFKPGGKKKKGKKGTESNKEKGATMRRKSKINEKK